MNNRIKYFGLGIFLFLFTLIIILWHIQVLKNEKYLLLSEKNRIRLVPIVAPRGNILDRNGVVLAFDKHFFELVAVPQDLSKNREELKELAKICGVDVEYFHKKIKERFVAPFYPVVLLRDVELSKVIKIEEQNIRFPGIRVREVFRRYYPQAETFAHIIGYTARPTLLEILTTEEFITDEDWIGRSGLEKTMDDVLRGKNGGTQVEIDNRGRMIRTLSWKGPEPGTDIRLTVDAGLQEFGKNLLAGRKGSIVVLDCSSASILAMVSSPSYNPNYFVSSDNRVTEILNDRRSIMLNRSLLPYPPGSIFKIITAISGLDKEIISPSQTFQCSGSIDIGNHRVHCFGARAHGSVNLHKGITDSCNTYFVNIGKMIGIDNISTYARIFNLGSPTGIELPFEKGGLVPDRIWKKKKINEDWYTGDTANISIGQGYVLTTPLQMANMALLVANNGISFKPRLIKTETNQNKKVSILSPEVFLPLKGAMEDVVRRGTGRLAGGDGISVAGKTGSAQVDNNRSHAWFIGYAPVKNPQIAFAVFLEFGGRGGEEPAIIAKKIVQYWMENSR